MKVEFAKMSCIYSLLFLDVLSFRGVLRDLVPFVQFNKCEEHPWRNVTFSKVLVQMVPNHSKCQIITINNNFKEIHHEKIETLKQS